MKPVLYIVEAPPSVVDQFTRVCSSTGLPFRVMRTEACPVSSPALDGRDDGSARPVLLRLSRVAELLNVSESTAGRLVRSGQLRAVRLGGATRVRFSDLERFVEQLGRDGQAEQAPAPRPPRTRDKKRGPSCPTNSRPT